MCSCTCSCDDCCVSTPEGGRVFIDYTMNATRISWLAKTFALVKSIDPCTAFENAAGSCLRAAFINSRFGAQITLRWAL